MTTHSPNVDDLILTIHSAALTEGGWSRIGNELRGILAAEQAWLLRVPSSPSSKPWFQLLNVDPAAASEYVRDWGPRDAWYLGALRTRRLGVGLVSLSDQLIERKELLRSPFFNEYLQRYDLDRMMNICLVGQDPGEGYGAAAMSFFRGVGKEPFSAEEARLLENLAPHLMVAASNFWSIRSLRLLNDAYHDAVDAVESAVFGIDSSGRVMFANQAGEELARRVRWVQVREGVLRVARGGVLEGISVEKALRQLPTGISFRCIVTDSASRAQAIMSGAPLVPSTPHPYPIRTAALVWVTPVVPNLDVAADLARLFELTPAERRLIARLVAGDELREAAENLHISLHTVRTQLKAVYRKTGRRTQSALLTLAARLAVLRTTHP